MEERKLYGQIDILEFPKASRPPNKECQGETCPVWCSLKAPRHVWGHGHPSSNAPLVLQLSLFSLPHYTYRSLWQEGEKQEFPVTTVYLVRWGVEQDGWNNFYSLINKEKVSLSSFLKTPSFFLSFPFFSPMKHKHLLTCFEKRSVSLWQ